MYNFDLLVFNYFLILCSTWLIQSLFWKNNLSLGLQYLFSGSVLYGFLLLTSGPTLLFEFRISFKFSLCWLLVRSEFGLGQFFNGVYSGPIWSRVCCPLGFIFLNSSLVHSKWVCCFFFLGSLWVCSRSLLNWDLLVASMTYRSFDLDLLFTVFNYGPTCLNSKLFFRFFPWFTPGSFRVCSGSILHYSDIS